VLALVLSSCAPSDPSSRPAPSGDLVVALQADVDSWNPYTTHEATSAGVLDLLYPRLLVEKASGESSSFEPWLARSWEFSPDRLRLTFYLREDAVWSDGAPVTCKDVRFTHGVQISDELAWSGAFLKDRISGVECPDDATAVFVFTEAYAGQILDANDDAIVPAAYGDVPLEEWAATPWEKRIVTSGPFRLSSVAPAQEAILERDPNWWSAETTRLDRVVLRIYPDATGILPRLLDGEVGLMLKVPPLRAGEVASREELKLARLPSLSYTYLGWNTLEPEAYLRDRRARGCGEEPPCRDTEADLERLQREHAHPVLGDPAVRRALTLAIDREDLVEGLWAGNARVGSSPIVSSLWAYDAETAMDFDPGQAAEWLDRAGWRDSDGDGVREKDGVPMRFGTIVNAENRVRRDALERVAASLSRVGVELTPEPLSRVEFVARARDKNFDAVCSGWWAGTRIEPQNLLHSRAALDRGNNLGSWSTPESDELLDRAAGATTREEALPLWKQWQGIFREQQPLTILYEEKRLLGIGAGVHAPTPNFLNPFQNLHEWWIAPQGI
jgi:peptide/nickel transport system substrate-binding protein